MERIKSFSINHDVLNEGIYISRIDGDVITYDLRMKKPNNGDYLDNAGLHTIEHLLATYVRNSSLNEHIVYAGPMGCRTGFYLLIRDKVDSKQAIKLIQDSFKFISEFNDEVPGCHKKECGNYLNHDLVGAKREAANYYKIIKNWTPEQLKYPE